MKLVVYEPDSKPFQHSESTLIDAEITEDNENLEEEQNGNMLGLNAHEKGTDTLPFVLNEEDGMRKTPDRDRNYFVSTDSLRNGKPKLIEEGGLYTDKSVMECELPEFLVCCKENFNPRVKDICIDDGSPSTNMIFVENGEEDSYTEDVNIEPCGLQELKSSEVNHCNNVTINSNRSITDKLNSSTENGHANQNDGETVNDAKDVIEDDTSKEKLAPENMLLDQDLASSKIDGNEVEQDSIQIPNGDANFLNPGVNFSTEKSDLRTIIEELSYNRKVESGSITFHFDSSTQDIDLERPIECPNTFIPGEDSSDDHQKASSLVQRDQMESSFASFSGLITYSGHIAYTGSLSRRSDTTSGATSTRSFAFPVLDTEWNSSPVRMAEAERRRYGKHRSWRMGLLCCRF